MRVRDWLHHLLDPHCPQCKEELEEKKIENECKACEILRLELDRASQEKMKLLEAIIQAREPELDQNQAILSPQPIPPKFIPWRVKRQMLEAESRQSAKILKDREKEIKESGMHVKFPEAGSIAELEKELGIAEEERESNNG